MDKLLHNPQPPEERIEPAWWFIFAGQRMMVLEEEMPNSVPLLIDPASLGLSTLKERYLGTLAGRDCYWAEIAEDEPVPPAIGLRGLRGIFGRLPEPFYSVALRASHLMDWEKKNRYCGRCGKETAPAVGEVSALKCSGCGLLAFPRISPAVIVLVERDGRVLLARSPRFTADFYSVLAGFVEPGETLEDTVHREIEEEVGIKVQNVRYFASQPWPFPDSLMIGFTAQYLSGEILMDKAEIIDAGWFDPAQLPPIPGKMSIARTLIDWFVEARLHEQTRTGLAAGS